MTRRDDICCEHNVFFEQNREEVFSEAKMNPNRPKQDSLLTQQKLTAEGETEGLHVGLIEGTGDGFGLGLGVGIFVGLGVLFS